MPSLMRFMVLLTGLIILVVSLMVGSSLMLLGNKSESLHSQDQRKLLAFQRDSLQRLVFVYRDIIRGYARDQVVKDLLVFSDPGQAAQWSMRVRRALPPVVGAALIKPDGDFVGEPVALRVGNACVKDIHDKLNGRDSPLIPIHDVIKELAHFDMSEPVVDEYGEQLGLVFISFSIDVLVDSLQHLADDNIAVRLVEGGSNKLIGSSQNWDALTEAKTVLLVDEVPGTGWQMQLKQREKSTLYGFREVRLILLVGVVVLITLVLFFSRMLSRRYFSEVEKIRAVVQSIQAGELVETSQLAQQNSLLPLGDILAKDLSELGQQHQDLQAKSHTDTLTGLANRRAFDESLASLFDENQAAVANFCLLLMDLDGFKGVNDTFGHAVGDQILLAFAQALIKQVRPGDLVSRWGGDEFAILLINISEEKMASWLARVREEFSQLQVPVDGLDPAARCGVSAGYIHVAQGSAGKVDELLHEADTWLYRDKQRQRSL